MSTDCECHVRRCIEGVRNYSELERGNRGWQGDTAIYIFNRNCFIHNYEAITASFTAKLRTACRMSCGLLVMLMFVKLSGMVNISGSMKISQSVS